MQSQEAELCTAAIQTRTVAGTFPPERAAPAGLARAGAAVRAVLVASFVIAAALRSPAGVAAWLSAACARASLGAVWWSSIILTSLPFVTAGAIAAAFAARVLNLRRYGAPLAAMLSPGCDCTLAGLTPALRQTPPALAGFAIAWGAIAGPSALIATHAAAGDALVGARLAGAFVAASSTALLWGLCAGRVREPGCDAHVHAHALVDRLFAALGGVCTAASWATLALVIAPDLLARVSSPFAAAAAGALLSPCSTADAVLARVLVHDRASQAAFVVAAQSVDVRQLTTIARSFGRRRMVLAAVGGCLGCIAAALVAR